MPKHPTATDAAKSNSRFIKKRIKTVNKIKLVIVYISVSGSFEGAWKRCFYGLQRALGDESFGPRKSTEGGAVRSVHMFRWDIKNVGTTLLVPLPEVFATRLC